MFHDLKASGYQGVIFEAALWSLFEMALNYIWVKIRVWCRQMGNTIGNKLTGRFQDKYV